MRREPNTDKASNAESMTDSQSSAISVSIASESVLPVPPAESSIEESMTAALDEAVAQLDAAVSPGDSSRSATASSGRNTTEIQEAAETPEVLQLIELLLQAPCRRDAAVALVQFLETQVTQQATVRCGYGKTKLVQLYDRRFGWLGSESSLHEEMSRQWEAPRRRASDPPEERAAAITRDGTMRLLFPNDNGNARYEVWISGDETTEQPWFVPAVSVIAHVIWSRPARSMPSLAKRFAQRSKTTLAIGGMMIFLLAVWPVHYRVASNARVETIHQRFVSAPFDATLSTAKVKPGDTVSQGDVLLVLDGRPLRLERESIEAEIQQAAKEHDSALVSGRVAEAQQAALKKQQLSRQYDLLSDRLQRLEVVSPIDGVIVSGDLQRFEGSTLERGQSLLEVAPMDKMVLEVELPEYEIGYVSQNAETRVKIDAIGGKSFTLPLQDVFPRSELREDQNVFIGRIELDNTDGKLRPGMQGEATTYGPLRPWVWSWVRGSVERTLWWIGY